MNELKCHWAGVITGSKLVQIRSFCFEARERECDRIYQADATTAGSSSTQPANSSAPTHTSEWNHGCSLPCSQMFPSRPFSTKTCFPVTLLCRCFACRVCVSIRLPRPRYWEVKQSGVNEGWDDVQWTCSR